VATARMPAELAPNCALVRAYEELARRLSARETVANDPQSRIGPGLVTRLLSSLGARI